MPKITLIDASYTNFSQKLYDALRILQLGSNPDKHIIITFSTVHECNKFFLIWTSKAPLMKIFNIQRLKTNNPKELVITLNQD